MRISDGSSDVCSSDRAGSDVEAFALGSGEAADALRDGELDGFFFVAGTPATAVLELAEEDLVDLVPITGPEIDKLLAEVPVFTRQALPAATYLGLPAVDPLSAGAQWVVSAEVPDDLVYATDKALWHPHHTPPPTQGKPQGSQP